MNKQATTHIIYYIISISCYCLLFSALSSHKILSFCNHVTLLEFLFSHKRLCFSREIPVLYIE